MSRSITQSFCQQRSRHAATASSADRARPVAVGVRGGRSARPVRSSTPATTVCATRSATVGTPERRGCPPPCGLRDLHRPHRGREVRPRRHPIPDLVQVVLQILLELRQRHLVHPRRTLVRPDLLHTPPRPPSFEISNDLPGDFSSPTRLLPGSSRLTEQHSHERPGPFAPPPLQGPHHYYEPVRRRSPATVLSPSRLRAARDTPSPHPASRPGHIRARLLHVPRGSRRPGSRRLNAGHRLASKRAPARLIPGSHGHPGFDATLSISTRHRTISFRSPSRSPPDASTGAFSSSLTTTVFSQRSMRRFEASPRRATPKGHKPSSPTQHRIKKPCLHRSSLQRP